MDVIFNKLIRSAFGLIRSMEYVKKVYGEKEFLRIYKANASAMELWQMWTNAQKELNSKFKK